MSINPTGEAVPIHPMFYEIKDPCTGQLKGCLLGAFHHLKSIGLDYGTGGSDYGRAVKIFGQDSVVWRCFERAGVVAVEYSSSELIAGIEALGNKDLAQQVWKEEVKTVTEDHGVDSRFEWMAYDRKKRIEGLETLEEHFSNEDHTVTAKSWNDIWSSIRRPAQCRESTVAKAYLQGSEEMWQFMNDKCIPDGVRAVLLQRNQRMVVKADAILKDPTTDVAFLTVGSAHLPGKDGMCELLRKQGWKVERVL
jgi:hypothetical protein